MSSKVIISIVALLVIVVGAWYFMGRSSAPSAMLQHGQMQQSEGDGQMGPESQQQTIMHNTSDASLDGDLNAIDTQASAATDAQASAGSFSDTPVQQTE